MTLKKKAFFKNDLIFKFFTKKTIDCQKTRTKTSIVTKQEEIKHKKFNF